MRASARKQLGLDFYDDASAALALLQRGGFVPDQERAQRLMQRGA